MKQIIIILLLTLISCDPKEEKEPRFIPSLVKYQVEVKFLDNTIDTVSVFTNYDVHQIKLNTYVDDDIAHSELNTRMLTEDGMRYPVYAINVKTFKVLYQ